MKVLKYTLHFFGNSVSASSVGDNFVETQGDQDLELHMTAFPFALLFQKSFTLLLFQLTVVSFRCLQKPKKKEGTEVGGFMPSSL